MEQLILAQQILFITDKYKFYAGIFNLIVGLIGNIGIILVFTTLRLFRGNQSAFYFITESISDIGLFLALNIPRFAGRILGYDPVQTSIVWCKIQNMALQACALYSLFTICFLSFDQYLSTNVRPSWRQKSTLKLAHVLTSVGMCFALLHSSTVFIIYEIQSSLGCNVYNPIAKNYYSFFYLPILANILPLAFTVTSSLLAYRNVRRIVRLQLPVIRRRLDRQMTTIILVRVIVMVVLGFPYIIISQYAMRLNITENNYLEIAIVSLLSAIFASLLHANFTVNFYVFLIVSSRFRRQTKTILVKKCWRSIKSCFNQRPTTIRMNQISPETPPPSVCHVIQEIK